MLDDMLTACDFEHPVQAPAQGAAYGQYAAAATGAKASSGYPAAAADASVSTRLSRCHAAVLFCTSVVLTVACLKLAQEPACLTHQRWQALQQEPPSVLDKLL